MDAIMQQPLHPELLHKHACHLVGVKTRVGFVGVEEVLVETSIAESRISYAFSGGLASLPVRNHAGHVLFEKEGRDSTEMTWKMSYDTVAVPGSAVDLMFRGAIPIFVARVKAACATE